MDKSHSSELNNELRDDIIVNFAEAIKEVFDDLHSMPDKEFHEELAKYEETELTATLLRADIL